MASKTSVSVATGEAAELWALWDRLKRIFPTWSVLPEAFYTPGAWGYVGVDFVSGFRKNPSTLKTFALLEDVDDACFDALSALANLNARRQEQLLRAVVIGYLTLPLTVTALAADLAGDSVMGLLRDHTTIAIQIAAMITLGPLGYFLSHWRSRQIVGVLDLIRIERGQAPFTALELREE